MEEVRKYENFTFNLKALKQTRIDELSRMVLDICAAALEDPKTVKRYEDYKSSQKGVEGK